MNKQKLKKSLFFSSLFYILTFSVQAQMIDLIGSMGIGAAQTTQSVKSVGQMNNVLRSQQFLNELQLKIADITTTYFGNYQQMPIRSAQIGNIKIIFRPVDNGQHYEAYISPLTQDLCLKLLQTRFDNLVRYRLVNDGSFQDYTVAQVRSNTGLCVTTDAMALIFQ